MVESPCIGICHISKEYQFCEGCFRSEEEISQWITFSDEQKKEILQLVTQRQINFISF